MNTRVVIATVVLAAASIVACASTQTTRVPPRSTPPSSPVASVDDLYDAGRYEEVIRAAGGESGVARPPAETWLLARSYLKVNRDDSARAELARLIDGPDPAWRLVGRLAVGTMNGEPGDNERAEALGETYVRHPFVQFEVGLSFLGRNDFAGAAQAFDRCIDADPGFAYAYYYAGLSYQRSGRADAAATRLETFSRLAPDAPERPAVESILSTVRGR